MSARRTSGRCRAGQTKQRRWHIALRADFETKRLTGQTASVHQPSFSGHSWTLRRAASRISCASMPTRVSATPNLCHSQTNSSGPLGGSGHPHHREN